MLRKVIWTCSFTKRVCWQNSAVIFGKSYLPYMTSLLAEILRVYSTVNKGLLLAKKGDIKQALASAGAVFMIWAKQLLQVPEFNRERERKERKRESVVLLELHLLRPPLDCSHFWLCCSFQPSLNIDRTDLLSNQRGKRYWSRNISTILHFQFWNYEKVVKL